jgi:hypothetical protein
MADREYPHISTVLQQIAQEQPDFSYDELAVAAEIEHSTSLLKRWPVKLLTILGGLLAMSTLMGFLMMAGLYNSGIGMFLFGLGFLVGAEVLVRVEKTFTADAMAVALNIAGYVLLAVGVGIQSESETAVALTLGIAAGFVLFFSRSTICVFIAVLVLSGSLLSLVFIHKVYSLAHVLVALLAGILIAMSLFEAKLLATYRHFIHAFGAVRMGVVFSLLGVLVLTVHQGMFSTRIGYLWVSGLVLVACLLWLLHRVLRESGVEDKKTLAIFYTCCALVLLPTLLSPSVPGALLVVLSSFYIGHRTGFWTGLLSLAYFIVLYYYDLNMTLLAKSGVLVLTGALFLGGLYLLNRYLRNHEA